MGNGALWCITPTMTSEYYGMKYFGRNWGFIGLIVVKSVVYLTNLNDFKYVPILLWTINCKLDAKVQDHKINWKLKFLNSFHPVVSGTNSPLCWVLMAFTILQSVFLIFCIFFPGHFATLLFLVIIIGMGNGALWCITPTMTSETDWSIVKAIKTPTRGRRLSNISDKNPATNLDTTWAIGLIVVKKWLRWVGSTGGIRMDIRDGYTVQRW
jgi:hypothetical protein